MEGPNPILHYVKTWPERRKIRKILSGNKFKYADIGPINQIAQVDHFVITVPKVGSTSIQMGFERLGHRVIHAHNNPTTYEAFANGAILRDAGIKLEDLCLFRRQVNCRPLYFFFGYREPIGAFLSLAAHYGLPLDDELKKDFLLNLNHGYPWSRYPFQDSQHVVETATGVRLLEREFDRQAGYVVLKNGKVTVVLYRFDRLESVAAYIRQNIEPQFELKSERKNDNSAYVAYCQSFKLPRVTLKELYADPVFRHFYSAEETEQWVEKYAAD